MGWGCGAEAVAGWELVEEACCSSWWPSARTAGTAAQCWPGILTPRSPALKQSFSHRAL